MDRDNGGGGADLIALATHLVQQYDWQWVSVAALVAHVELALGAGTGSAEAINPAARIEQAAGRLLYQGCQDPRTRDMAYQDLARYLAGWTRYLAPPAPGSTWDDLVQETLRQIYEHLATCREPEVFLHWAVVILKRTAVTTWRRLRPGPLDAPGVAELMTPAADDLGGEQALLQLLHDCLDTDEERTWALAVFFAGLRRREWALLFDTPVTRYDALGRQVKAKLRRSARVQAFFADARR